MAKLNIVDDARAESLYLDLLKGLAGEPLKKIGHNTYLVRKNGCVYLRLYWTDIVEVTPENEVTYDPGSYLTTTTLERMNHIARLFGLCASRAGGKLRVAERKVRNMTKKSAQDDLDALLETVAQEAYPFVLECYQNHLDEITSQVDPEGTLDEDARERALERVLEQTESLYLWVYPDGSWTIDAPDYLQDHRFIATAPIANYANQDTLRYELEQSTF